jgi:hypothetical protein
VAIGYNTQFVASFTVPFAKGTLAATCVNMAGAKVATLTTTGAAVALKATADQATIPNSRRALSYVTVEVVDMNGYRVPDSRERLKFNVSGGELQAVGTGDPTDVSSFHSGTRVTYQGRAVAILRSVALDPLFGRVPHLFSFRSTEYIAVSHTDGCQIGWRHRPRCGLHCGIAFMTCQPRYGRKHYIISSVWKHRTPGGSRGKSLRFCW